MENNFIHMAASAGYAVAYTIAAAENAIFKNRTQNIECRFGCVVRSAVLLKPNVANILFNSFNIDR